MARTAIAMGTNNALIWRLPTQFAGETQPRRCATGDTLLKVLQRLPSARHDETAMAKLPLRDQIEDAAIDCKSITIAGASDRVTSIKRVAQVVARLFRRVVTVEVIGNDGIVSFTARPSLD